MKLEIQVHRLARCIDKPKLGVVFCAHGCDAKISAYKALENASTTVFSRDEHILLEVNR